jgi:hypothetical protein
MFRRYAVFPGTVIDVSALRRVYWYSYRRFGVTKCSMVQLSMFRRYAVFTGTVIDVSVLRRVHWYSYRRFGATLFTDTVIEVSALRRVHWYSYRRFGATLCLLVQLSKFRLYAVFTGSYRRFGVTPCLLVQLSTFRCYAVFTGTVIDFRRYAVPAGKVIGVSKDRSAFTFGSPSPGRVSADPHLQQRRSQNLTHFRRSPRSTFVWNCVNVTCRVGPERRRFLTCCSMCVNNIL